MSEFNWIPFIKKVVASSLYTYCCTMRLKDLILIGDLQLGIDMHTVLGVEGSCLGRSTEAGVLSIGSIASSETSVHLINL